MGSKITSYILYSIVISLLIIGCSCEGPKPRRPVEVRSGSFFKASVARSKKLLAEEEARMKQIMQKDTAHKYLQSPSGGWYRMEVTRPDMSYTPKADDLVTMTYNIVGFNGDTLYRKEQIGVVDYKVDKQELFPGLRGSVKLLKKGETATFLYPSSLAYGYHGDNDKIGVNVPVSATLTILDIQIATDSIQ